MSIADNRTKTIIIFLLILPCIIAAEGFLIHTLSSEKKVLVPALPTLAMAADTPDQPSPLLEQHEILFGHLKKLQLLDSSYASLLRAANTAGISYSDTALEDDSDFFDTTLNEIAVTGTTGNTYKLDSVCTLIDIEEVLFEASIDRISMQLPADASDKYKELFRKMITSYRAVLHNRSSIAVLRNTAK